MNTKPKFAMYWASACGGCEVSLINIHEKLVDLAKAFDIVFFPCIMDAKKKDLEALPDKAIDLTFFNGAIRNDEDREMAHILRTKSRLLVAYGSCACEGCIPGLSNLFSKEDHFRTIYIETSTTVNPKGVVPVQHTRKKEGKLVLPAFHDQVQSLGQTVPVDSYLPGCPPEGHQVEMLIDMLLENELPEQFPRIIGAGEKGLCHECPLTRRGFRISRFYRPQEFIPEPGSCLLEQGLFCMGPATRSGCNAKCPRHQMGCLGCYGSLPGVEDQGAAILAAIASILELPADGTDNGELKEYIKHQLSSIADPAGQFYKFSLPVSLLGGKCINGEQGSDIS